MSTDPTYLRAIHDSLLSGMLHKDNASALPMGLVGMYEEALPLASHANEREKFLAFFAVWALLKKEVGAGFVVPLLKGWTENQVLDYIGRYSKWFNSPESGKYVLYHERFRAFLLQKFPQNRLARINEALIYQCQLALDSKSGDEWERYALEYLSTHLLISAMESKDAAKLKALAYDNAHWNRQVAMSKGFEWSKRMLNDMMLWASKYDEDEVIECLLSKVDLHQQEQNDAPRIVELVAQNDIETVLQRIEAFGGTDKEGLQRKFILYMLCLMELTLLESKDKPFRKEGIERLLKHLDDNLPVDHSVLNWNDFFPSYLVFLMACEWAVLGLDYKLLYKRTDDWEKDWISAKGPYSNIQFEVLLECAGCIIDAKEKSRALAEISIEQSKQGMADEAASTMQQFFSFARSIGKDVYKCRALAEISTELAKQGKVEEAASAMQEALNCASGISVDYLKSRALKNITTELSKQGKVEKALTCARGISDDHLKSIALKAITTELSKQGKVNEAHKCASGIGDDYLKSIALKDISTKLSKQGKVNEALTCARGISSNYWKSRSLNAIFTKLSKQGMVEEAASAMQEALTCARGINDESEKSSALMDIYTELSEQGMVEEASSAMQEALTCVRVINNESEKSSSLMNISIQLAKQGNLMLAEQVSLEIPLTPRKFSCWKEIAKDSYEKHGISVAIHQADKFQNIEVKMVYLKGLADSIILRDFEKELILNAARFYNNDIESMQKLLQQYALRELFFNESAEQRMERLNRTLNLQWAIDIKNSLYT